jgi:hypothetical protein
MNNVATSVSVTDPHPHDFGLLDPHTESAFQMRIPYVVADPDPATQKIVPKIELLIRSSTLCDKKLKFLNILLLFKNRSTLKISYTITRLAIVQ